MNRLIVAFDVNGTLLTEVGDSEVPNYENISIYRWFQSHGHLMVVWSSGGADYARMWADKLGLNPDRVCDKYAGLSDGTVPDLAFDDQDVTLGVVNVKVGN